MPADPQPGLDYREEYYAGEAEDAATVLSLDEQAEVPAGHYDDALMTSNVNPLEPKVQEYKFYARASGRCSRSDLAGHRQRGARQVHALRMRRRGLPDGSPRRRPSGRVFIAFSCSRDNLGDGLSMRILIVEDEPKMAGLIRRGLEREGMAADVAGNGEDALWRAQATEYDAIVLDVMLPGDRRVRGLPHACARRGSGRRS